MANFFISFNRKDRRWAAWIAWTVEAAGYTVTFQDWDFRPGNLFAIEMDKALASSDRMIAVLSENYLNSVYTHPEWTTVFAGDSMGQGRNLVPIKIAPCNPKGLLKTIIAIDLVGLNQEQAKKALREGLQKRLKPPVSPDFPPETDASTPEQLTTGAPTTVMDETVVKEAAPVVDAPVSTPEPPPPQRPEPTFPLTFLLRRRWIIAAVIASLLVLSYWQRDRIQRSVLALVGHSQSQEELQKKYEQQTVRLRELLPKDDTVLSDEEAKEMEKLAVSLYHLQQRIDPPSDPEQESVQSDWAKTYHSLQCSKPHILTRYNIQPPPPHEVHPCP